MIFSHSDPALIESAPVDQGVLEKDNVTLHCNATGNPTPNITWTKDNSSLVLHQGDIYSIVNITRDAAGNYTCTAWNGVGEQKKAIAEVTVHCELIFFMFRFLYIMSNNDSGISFSVEPCVVFIIFGLLL